MQNIRTFKFKENVGYFTLLSYEKYQDILWRCISFISEMWSKTLPFYASVE